MPIANVSISPYPQLKSQKIFKRDFVVGHRIPRCAGVGDNWPAGRRSSRISRLCELCKILRGKRDTPAAYGDAACEATGHSRLGKGRAPFKIGRTKCPAIRYTSSCVTDKHGSKSELCLSVTAVEKLSSGADSFCCRE
jgi:hypothetical protein